MVFAFQDIGFACSTLGIIIILTNIVFSGFFTEKKVRSLGTLNRKYKWIFR